MSTPQPKFIFRMPPGLKSWLAIRAASNRRSMTAELLTVLTSTMKKDPVYAVVRRMSVDGEEFYCATLCEGTESFFECANRDDAIAAARKKLKELGLDRACIEFREVPTDLAVSS